MDNFEKRYFTQGLIDVYLYKDYVINEYSHNRKVECPDYLTYDELGRSDYILINENFIEALDYFHSKREEEVIPQKVDLNDGTYAIINGGILTMLRFFFNEKGKDYCLERVNNAEDRFAIRELEEEYKEVTFCEI